MTSGLRRGCTEFVGDIKTIGTLSSSAKMKSVALAIMIAATAGVVAYATDGSDVKSNVTETIASGAVNANPKVSPIDSKAMASFEMDDGFQRESQAYRERYRGSDTIEFKNISYVDAFSHLNDAETKILKTKKTPIWYFHKHNDAFKMGADSIIRCSDLAVPLEKISLLSDDRSITILSGSHGDRHGVNWVRLKDDKSPNLYLDNPGEFIRNPTLLERTFYDEDMSRCEGMYRRFTRSVGNITVLDVATLRVNSIKKAIKGDDHVIFAYCYGRNDKAFRFYLGLRSVISYVPRRP